MTRFLIVYDGGSWFVRQLASSTQNEMVYRCDKHLGGPFDTLDEAVRLVKAQSAGCTCKANSHIQSSMHARRCALRFE